MSRVECQPPMLDAPIEGCAARRRKMISVNSALRSSAPGSITAATGVANNPFTSTSAPDMPLFEPFCLHERKRGGKHPRSFPPRSSAVNQLKSSCGLSLLVRNFRLPALDQFIVVLRDALRLLVGELALRGDIAVLLGLGVPVLRGLLLIELRPELALHAGFLQPAQDLILSFGQS